MARDLTVNFTIAFTLRGDSDGRMFVRVLVSSLTCVGFLFLSIPSLFSLQKPQLCSISPLLCVLIKANRTNSIHSYFTTGQLMLNGFLQSQGFPKNTQFDVLKPSETISNMINHAVKKNLKVDIDAMPYVKPSVGYIKDVLKLGKSREYLQKMNTTELSNKLTDTFNLEVSFLRKFKLLRYLNFFSANF